MLVRREAVSDMVEAEAGVLWLRIREQPLEARLAAIAAPMPVEEVSWGFGWVEGVGPREAPVIMASLLARGGVMVLD